MNLSRSLAGVCLSSIRTLGQESREGSGVVSRLSEVVVPSVFCCLCLGFCRFPFLGRVELVPVCGLLLVPFLGRLEPCPESGLL